MNGVRRELGEGLNAADLEQLSTEIDGDADGLARHDLISHCGRYDGLGQGRAPYAARAEPRKGIAFVIRQHAVFINGHAKSPFVTQASGESEFKKRTWTAAITAESLIGSKCVADQRC